MQPIAVIIALLVFVCSAMAQFPQGFYPGAFSGGFPSSFTGLSGAQQVVPTAGNGRASTGPVLFPSSPESRDTSGVIVGASGYGFIPPGVNSLVQQQGRAAFDPCASAGQQGGDVSKDCLKKAGIVLPQTS